MEKAIVSMSGGMDSATVLALAVQSFDVFCVGFTYGSKHNKYENEAARSIARYYEVPYKLIDLSAIMADFKSDLLLSGGEIPEGHYEAESMKRTVVPARNLIFASILTGIAVSQGAKAIFLGVHAGDHVIYPDCREGFIHSLRHTIQLAIDDDDFQVLTPFLYRTKTDILEIGLPLRVPYHLTRTCYKDQAVACGKCGSCQERLIAFRDVSYVMGRNVIDLVYYESRDILPKESANDERTSDNNSSTSDNP